jgi:hypothetical protein
MIPTHFDLQPAIAACRAAAAGSRMLLVQMTRPVIDPRYSLNKIANVGKLSPKLIAVPLQVVVSGAVRARAATGGLITEGSDKCSFVAGCARQTGSDTCSAYHTIDNHLDPMTVSLRPRIRAEPFVRQ